jgi:hypothetical protein
VRHARHKHINVGYPAAVSLLEIRELTRGYESSDFSRGRMVNLLRNVQ